MTVSKTNEVIVDFKKNPTIFSTGVIKEQTVEYVHEYSLNTCTVIDDKLTFDHHIAPAYLRLIALL